MLLSQSYLRLKSSTVCTLPLRSHLRLRGSGLDFSMSHESPVGSAVGPEHGLLALFIDLHLKGLHVRLHVLIGWDAHSWQHRVEQKKRKRTSSVSVFLRLPSILSLTKYVFMEQHQKSNTENQSCSLLRQSHPLVSKIVVPVAREKRHFFNRNHCNCHIYIILTLTREIDALLRYADSTKCSNSGSVTQLKQRRNYDCVVFPAHIVHSFNV